MLKVLFTLDYEISGNGEGCPHKVMVEPTERMLRLFDQYGAKLTIMAEIGEILRFKEYAELHGQDKFYYGEIEAQLKDAVRRGHDVQLHIHSSYFNANFDGRTWVQNWPEYDFASLNLDRMTSMVKRGKEFLESILQPVNPNYRCKVFRAANWSVTPSKNVVEALLANGIKIDTSIFKYGRRNHLVIFDYSNACSDLVPWRADKQDMCKRDDQAALWEFPIYAENRRLGAFLSLNRFCRAMRIRRYFSPVDLAVAQARKPGHPATKQTLMAKALFLTKRHAWKADFNQCTGRQLIAALLRAESKASGISDDIPFVLIGHSKLFNSLNEKSLRPFLEFVAQNKERFGFETFAHFEKKIQHQNYLAVHNASCAASTAAALPTKAERSYVLVTPAHNEQATIESTIKSVLAQTRLPKEWVVVSDRSTDQTDEIVKRYAASHSFIKLLRIDGQPKHSFASVVQATEAGLRALQSKDYSYVGLLDADVKFAPDYYDKLMAEFDLDPKLGVAGGLVLDSGYSEKHPYQNLSEIPGATQFFSRACFESLGGLMPIPEGGWDAVTAVQARMNGFRTATIPKLVMDHLKPRNFSQGNSWQRNWQLGQRDYAMGGHSLFEILKCISRVFEPPVLEGAIARFCGFFYSVLNRRKRLIPDDMLNYIQREQLQRITALLRRRPRGRA